MAVCCCSLAGTAACRRCTNNPQADAPPPVRTSTVYVTDKVLITGRQTNADRIRAMTDEELAEFLAEEKTAPSCTAKCHKDYEIYGELRTFCSDCWLDWLKQEVGE